MTTVVSVPPQAEIDRFLPGASFIDAYQVTIQARPLTAADAARTMFLQQPRWAKDLMRLRNQLVRPLGLKTEGGAGEPGSRIGIFPIILETPDQIVMGFEDLHLDFRAVIEVDQSPERTRVTATTLVKLNNLLGRIYLTAILPFHKVIVRDALRRLEHKPGDKHASVKNG